MTSGAAFSARDPADSDDGWVHVKPKAHRRGAKARQIKHDKLISENLKFNLNDKTSSEDCQTPHQLETEYQRARAQYEEERACKTLKRLVEDNEFPAVSKAVCLGIGTFDPPDGGWDTKRRTYIQLSAFVVLVQSLGSYRPSLGSGHSPLT